MLAAQTAVKLPVFSIRVIFLALLINLSLGTGASFAQADVAPELLDRPPVAAPTSQIAVGAIPVVLSESQEVDNFARGLLQGLMAGRRVDGVALVVVKEDRVMLQRNLGAIAPDTRIPAGALAGVFETLTAMQLIERMRLTANNDIGTILGETAPRGVTLAQVLTHQTGDPSLLARVVERISGAHIYDTVAKEIAQPLGMMSTSARNDRLETTLSDVSHLAIALVNGGAFENGRILEPASVDLLERTEVTLHPALPGWTYGFAEMRRNGWRALQRDGVEEEFATRLVIVPETRLAYFLVARGATDADFWRTLDNGLFDKLLPPRMMDEAAPSQTPAPSAAEARAAAGTYEPARDGAFSLAVLKIGGRLKVDGANDGGLILSGAENATLAPRPGGYWTTTEGNITAVARDGRLVLSTGAYRPLAFYKRPILYAVLALLLALAAAGWIFYERRRKPERVFPTDMVLGAASASAALFLISVFVWLFAPVA